MINIWFDWTGYLFVNGHKIGKCTETEMLEIGLALGWYDL